MQHQFTLHLHFVFNRNECAQPECSVFFTTSPPHARCLTLTLAPDGAGPGCSRVRESRGQQPFRYPRVRRTRHHARTLLFQVTVAVTPCVTARVRHQRQPLSRIYLLNCSSLRSSVVECVGTPTLWSAGHVTQFPRRHRVDTCASVSCPARESASLTPSAVLAPITACTSTLFRLHRWPDSSALRPLHSLTHSASPTSLDALAHSDGRKLPRPALTAVHPKT